MRICMCVGNYAAIPYRMPELGLTVYSMEELCYGLKENVMQLDISIMNDSLLEWIKNGCGLGDLAKELHPMVHKQGTLSGFVGRIMRYVGLYPEEDIRNTEQLLKRGSGLSWLEKRTNQLDYLVIKGRYAAAVKGYEALLEYWQEAEKQGLPNPQEEVKETILYHKGVAYTRLMLYGPAAESFQEAYVLTGKEEYRKKHFVAKYLELGEADYRRYVTGLADYSDIAEQLEKELAEAQKQVEQQPQYQETISYMALRSSEDKQQYYKEQDRLTQNFRDSYRKSVME